MTTIVSNDRGRRGLGFTLPTPEDRYISRLPNLPGARFYKLATPRIAPARFGQYLVAAPPEGVSWSVEPGYEHFLFGRAGQASVSFDAGGQALDAGGFAYIPSNTRFTVTAKGDSEVIWFKRRYES